KRSLIVVHLEGHDVHGNLGTRRRRSLSAGHDRDDGGPEDIGWLRAAHGTQQSGSHTAAWLLLGRRRHAPRAIIQRDYHDDYWSRHRWLVDVPAGLGSRFRCECRPGGPRFAGRPYRGSRLGYGRRTGDDLRRRPHQAFGPESGIRGGCRACWVWACTFWTDDPAAGHGW